MKRVVALAAGVAGLMAGFSAAPVAWADGQVWKRAESAHFIVYSNNTEDRTREFVDRLEAFEDTADKLYQQIGDSELPDDGKHVVYYLNSVVDFNTMRPGSVEGYTASFNPYLTCPFESPRYFGVDVGESRQKAESEYLNFDLSYTYFAYVRTKNIKYFADPLPAWLDNGLKYYLMTMNIEPDKVVVGQLQPELAEAIQDGAPKLVSFSSLLTNSYPKDTGSDVINLEDWFLTHWLVSTPENRPKLVAFLAKVHGGEDPVKAFTEATGQAPDDLMPTLKTYLAKGVPIRVYAHTPTPADAIALTHLPDYGGAPLPLISAALWRCAGPYYGKSLLGRVRGIAKAFPDDALAQRTLLTGEVLFGDTSGEAQAAQAPLEQIVAAHPDDAEAFTLLGRLHLRLAEAGGPAADADYAAARAAFGKAYTLDPASPAVLALLSQARADLPGYPDDQARQAMALAQSYSDDGYDIYVAELDVRGNDYAGALKTLANWHPERGSGEWKTKSGAVLDALRSGAPKSQVLAAMAAYEAFLAGPH